MYVRLELLDVISSYPKHTHTLQSSQQISEAIDIHITNCFVVWLLLALLK